MAVQGGGQAGAVCSARRHSKLASELLRLTDTSGATLGREGEKEQLGLRGQELTGVGGSGHSQTGVGWGSI